ncbi:glycosyltransferase [Blastococcus sp. BMG 814]|uniref:Glycosyltransferase n=1 Tax=Blastococcus carthaginiensis TaxID=3050034 RepID=A0ABT9IFG7_9ACTN|nr:glycosyltransferase [Blastococcus carthaginiensis]MDP5183835.1 glycosyltransferase [Blastococcus carthaginiensis]
MTVVIDLAGGQSGGAGRFRAQYLEYASDHGSSGLSVIGLDHFVTPRWLLRREAVAFGSEKVIAANNVSFALAGKSRWTLLRNANHFLSREEWQEFAQRLGRGFATQTQVVRAAARRSDVLVVPSSSMADRVATVLPELADRIVVRLHPLSVPPKPPVPPSVGPTILCPIVNSAYKHLVNHLELLQQALGSSDARVVCTIRPDEASPTLRTDDRFSLVGLLSRERLRDEYDAATAVYFPTSIESFGYPLAEARAAGMPVLAQETDHNREIAGPALFGYRSGQASSLGAAVSDALSASLTPDPVPFDPATYFDWLLH